VVGSFCVASARRCHGGASIAPPASYFAQLEEERDLTRDAAVAVDVQSTVLLQKKKKMQVRHSAPHGCP
jgi:hypothetical protein